MDHINTYNYHTAENFCWRKKSPNPPTLAITEIFRGINFAHLVKIAIGSISNNSMGQKISSIKNLTTYFLQQKFPGMWYLPTE